MAIKSLGDNIDELLDMGALVRFTQRPPYRGKVVCEIVIRGPSDLTIAGEGFHPSTAMLRAKKMFEMLMRGEEPIGGVVTVHPKSWKNFTAPVTDKACKELCEAMRAAFAKVKFCPPKGEPMEQSQDLRVRFNVDYPVLTKAQLDELLQIRSIVHDACDQVIRRIAAGREAALVITKMQEALFWAEAGLRLTEDCGPVPRAKPAGPIPPEPAGPIPPEPNPPGSLGSGLEAAEMQKEATSDATAEKPATAP